MSSAFIYSDDFRGYSFSPDHPFNQLRVTLTYDLLQKGGFISPSQIISPRMATDEEIAYVHTEEYINAVKRAGEGKLEKSIAMTYGLGTEDTPMFPNMHEASALLVGGTFTPVEVSDEEAINLFHGIYSDGLRALQQAGGMGEATQNMSQYTYKASLDSQDGLSPGYHVSLQVNLENKTMIAVPSKSIVEKGDDA
ncbi:hypothetical protein ACT4US_15990, partial [Bacillus sp. HC-Mk]